jgi:hypothetical protein
MSKASQNGNGMTQKELLLETRSMVFKLDEKLDTVIVGHGERLVKLEEEGCALRDDFQRARSWATGIIAGLCGSWILAMLATLSGCMETSQITSTLIPSPEYAPTSTDEPTDTITPTIMPTVTPTREYIQTPTPTIAVPTPTPWIIEVTPIGGMQWPPSADYWQALPDGVKFITLGTVNVRDCPSTACAIVERYGIGVSVNVYAIWHRYGKSEKWLCLTPDLPYDKETACPRAMAWVYNDQELGRIDWPD